MERQVPTRQKPQNGARGKKRILSVSGTSASFGLLGQLYSCTSHPMIPWGQRSTVLLHQTSDPTHWRKGNRPGDTGTDSPSRMLSLCRVCCTRTARYRWSRSTPPHRRRISRTSAAGRRSVSATPPSCKHKRVQCKKIKIKLDKLEPEREHRIPHDQ